MIAPALLGLSFLLPLIYGYFRKPWTPALLSGWALVVIVSRLHGYILPALGRYAVDIENLTEQVEQAVATKHFTTLAICAGWLIPLLGFLLGKWLRQKRAD